MPVFDANALAHYGTPRKSGRYPYGSGGNEGSKKNMSWLDAVKDMRSQGLSDKDIYEGMKMSSGQFRARMTIERAADKTAKIHDVKKLAAKGMGGSEISRRTGIPEATVRTLLKEGAADKANALLSTAEMLKKEVDAGTWIDIGTGVENHLGISAEKLRAAASILQEQGYTVNKVKKSQIGTGHETEFKVLGLPGKTQKDLFLDSDNIKQVSLFSIDGGKTYSKKHSPIPVDPKRLQVRWAEDGGAAADGVIYVRPGAKDLSMNGNHYAQVRIQVGPKHYLKGMAVLKDDMPPGVDLLFNTNKSRSDNKLDALKGLKDDPDNPFGSVTRQIVENHGQPNERNISAMNLVNEAGRWQSWSKALASQVLSKQSPVLARQQLEKTFDRKKKEFDEINALTNPVVKKKLLETFASEADSAAVHLKAVSLHKDSAWHVILPVENMKPTEVFAPGYPNGTRVALVRYPHGGPFEIPDLVVNNRSRTALRSIGKDSVDAIGIHPSVAERLSGADFDGDAVIVIPNGAGRLRSQPALKGLQGFEPKSVYRLPDNAPGIRDLKDPGGQTQRIMGEASNLITDMSIRGAGPDKMARAVKYSMVAIDAEKHHLDYKKAKADLGIKALKDEFQQDPTNPNPKARGASTLISRAGSEARIVDRKLRPMADGGPIDKKTGALVYVPTNKTRKLRDGTTTPKMIKVEKLALTDDAHTLSSGTVIEKVYANHSNSLKGLANQARLAANNTPSPKVSLPAKKVYATEIESLGSKLYRAQLNAPRERQAQVIANTNMKLLRQANPNMDKDRLRKLGFDELTRARKRTGAGKELIDITDREWEAIQSGAVSASRLKEILSNTDIDRVKKLAQPRTKPLMTNAKTSRANAMLANGATRAEVAAALGVSLTTLDVATTGAE